MLVDRDVMFGHLPNKIADYTLRELNVTPQNVLSEEGSKKQTTKEFDDGSMAVVTLSGQTRFNISLQWDILSHEDAGEILDFYHDSAKANGMASTFYWRHPTDGHVYVARFLGPLMQVRQAKYGGQYREVSQIQLRIEGRKAE